MSSASVQTRLEWTIGQGAGAQKRLEWTTGKGVGAQKCLEWTTGKGVGAQKWLEWTIGSAKVARVDDWRIHSTPICAPRNPLDGDLRSEGAGANPLDADLRSKAIANYPASTRWQTMSLCIPSNKYAPIPIQQKRMAFACQRS